MSTNIRKQNTTQRKMRKVNRFSIILKKAILCVVAFVMIASTLPNHIYVLADDTTETFQITYTAGEGGTVSTRSETASSTETSIKGSAAQPNDNYRFVDWTDKNGTVVSNNLIYVPNLISSNEDYTANFQIKNVDDGMQAFQLTGHSTNGITVTVSADPGTFPSGTTMKVAAVSTAEAVQSTKDAIKGDIVDAQAVDITFIDKNNQIVEPADNTKVHVTLRSEKEVGGTTHSIVHIGSNGAEKIADASSTGANFDATSFSIYAIVGQLSGKATITYEFYDDASTPTLLSTSIVKNGDVFTAPGTPTSKQDPSATFLGWSPVDKPTEFQTFGNTVSIPDTQSTDTTVKLYARFQKTYHVFFYNQYNRVIKTFDVQGNSDFHIADYTAYVTFPIPVDMAVVDWSTQIAPVGNETGLGDESAAVADLTNISNNVNLYPVLKSVYWITYKANGGSFTAAEFMKLGTNTEAPTVPTRPGYTFNGWYLDADLTQPFTFGSPLSSNIMLYAKWTANPVNYMIVYWVESLDANKKYVPGNYVYMDSETLQATVDSEISITAANVTKNYQFYTFDHGDQNVNVDGNGNTVINAYFRLNTYKFTFDLVDTTSATASRISTMTINSNQYDSNSPYSFTAHFGENIADKWPTSGNISVSATGSIDSKFYGWTNKPGVSNRTIYVTKRFNVTPEMLVTNTDESVSIYTAEFLPSTVSTVTYIMNYWLENAQDTAFTQSAEYSQEAQAKENQTWNAKQINGFNYISTGNPEGYPASSGTTINYYYTRNTYDLVFNNYGVLDKTVSSIKSDCNISDQYYVPERPSALSSDYQFDGWYTTPGCIDGTKYNFTNAVMPSNNLALYANWIAPKFTVHFDLNGATSSAIPDQVNMYGKLVSRPEEPTRTGYAFSGWTLAGKTFNYDSNYIAGNVLNYADKGIITLRANWIGGDTLTIKYDAGSGTDAPIDLTGYYSSADAVVGVAPNPPEGKSFLYWTAGGNIYYPGSSVNLESLPAVNGIVTLTAVYGEDTLVSLSYHSNYGNGSDYTTGQVKNNAEITILDNTDSLISYYRDGYIFNGWNTKPDGRGSSFAAGAVVRIDNIGGNDLYAQWIKINSYISPDTGESIPSPIIPMVAAIAVCLILIIKKRYSQK